MRTLVDVTQDGFLGGPLYVVTFTETTECGPWWRRRNVDRIVHVRGARSAFWNITEGRPCTTSEWNFAHGAVKDYERFGRKDS